MDRRTFLAQSGLVTAAVGLGAHGVRAAEAPLPPMPKIKLGDLEVSRFILGSNPFGGYAHQPGPLGKQMKEWYTPERIMAVLDEAGGYGVTTCSSPPDPSWCQLWRDYRKRGGQLKLWLAQCHGNPDKMPEEIARAAEAGAAAIFIQGHVVESQYEKGKFETVRGWLEAVRKLKLPAGMASHRPDVHLEAERLGFPTDFYYQCFYNVGHGEVYRAEDRLKAVETIAKLPKPVVGYKLLAAGRNEPKDAFDFARAHLRPTDGMCVGIYLKERPGELRADVALALGA